MNKILKIFKNNVIDSYNGKLEELLVRRTSSETLLEIAEDILK